jgi:hypothetical protein
VCTTVKKGKTAGYKYSREQLDFMARKRQSLYIYSTTGKMVPLDGEGPSHVVPRQSIQEIAKQCGFQVIKGKVTTI